MTEEEGRRELLKSNSGGIPTGVMHPGRCNAPWEEEVAFSDRSPRFLLVSHIKTSAFKQPWTFTLTAVTPATQTRAVTFHYRWHSCKSDLVFFADVINIFFCHSDAFGNPASQVPNKVKGSICFVDGRVTAQEKFKLHFFSLSHTSHLKTNMDGE